MPETNSVIRRFPTHEFTVRRLFTTDCEFKEVCEDYAVAIDAFERWKGDETKAEYYANIVRELEQEILEYLEADQADLRQK